MSSSRDRIIALRQARIAYAMARRRLSRLNTEENNGPRRGKALRDCWRARQHLHDEIVRTRGWLDGRRALRAEQVRARCRHAIVVSGTSRPRVEIERRAQELAEFLGKERGPRHDR